MAVTKVGKIFNFSAAHRLKNYNGKCNRLHGHNFTLEVEVEGPIQITGPTRGMIIDFENLKSLVEEHLDAIYDHHYLNETVIENPTAELLAADLFEYVSAKLAAPVFVTRVRLWETDSSYAEVTA